LEYVGVVGDDDVRGDGDVCGDGCGDAGNTFVVSCGLSLKRSRKLYSFWLPTRTLRENVVGRFTDSFSMSCERLLAHLT
jgi:hypothetical protein